MRILILSGNTGEGHNSAAKALKEYFDQRGCNCEICDGLAYMAYSSGPLVAKGHVILYRKLPFLFGLGYRFEEFVQRHRAYQEKLESKAQRIQRKQRLPRHRRKLKEFIEAGNYDAVISVHVFTAAMLSELRKTGALNIPTFFMSTDYTCCPGANQLDMDAWLIPHRNLLPEFVGHGIPEEKIITTGIPIRGEFLERTSRAEARRMLSLPEDKKIVVLSCGSMGASSMGRLVLLLVETLPEDTLLVAICGNNRKLERNLRRLIRSEKLKVMGFVDSMESYMDAADLYISKPGGLSTTEAIFKRVPMALIHAVPGCETRNLEFLTTIGCAISAPGPIRLARLVRLTLKSNESLEYLAKKCSVEFTRNGAEMICDTIIDRHALRLLDDAVILPDEVGDPA